MSPACGDDDPTEVKNDGDRWEPLTLVATDDGLPPVSPEGIILAIVDPSGNLKTWLAFEEGVEVMSLQDTWGRPRP